MNFRRLPLALAVVIQLAGCIGHNSPQLADPGAIDYVLGPGDRLRVTVYANEESTTEATINDRGMVTTPIAGELRATGLSLSQFEAQLDDKLKVNYLRNPRVSIEITAYRPFYILGEVAKPGGYPYAPGLTVLGAVALGGGYSYRADKDKVEITRTYGTTKPEDGSALPAGRVLPDDVIRVPERMF
jgi:protein involved in polysaccharide export with SLBB domain